MQQTRRQFLGAAATATLGACASHTVLGAAATRPNFVVVLCDDLGYGDIGCFGNPVIETPRLDGFAEEGIRLTDCYAAAPVCSPSRAGMLTGRNPYRCNIPDWIPERSPVHLQDNEVTIARLLRDAGYRTCHSGKWHCNGFMDGSQPTPGDHGFEHWFSTQNNALPSHANPVNFIRNGESVGPLNGYSSALIVDEAIQFLDSVGDAPFVLFVWFHSPHEPVATAPAFQKRYDDEQDETKRIYFGNVTQMDYETGRLLDALDARGMRESTFVLFSSDNGPETLGRYKGAEHSHGTPGPLRGMKLHLHEGGIRVPGIVRWPGHTSPGSTCREPVCGTDVLPTLCALAELPVPADRALDGADISSIFRGRSPRRECPLYWRYDRALGVPKVALRDGNWKILADATLESLELYDLAHDPSERHNLATSNPKRLRRLRDRLRSIHDDVAAESAKRGGVPV